MPTGPYLCLYQILSKYFKRHTQDFGLEIHSGEVTREKKTHTHSRFSFLHATRLLVLIYAERGVWSGSTLFALNSEISTKHDNNKANQTPLKLEIDQLEE